MKSYEELRCEQPDTCARGAAPYAEPTADPVVDLAPTPAAAPAPTASHDPTRG